MEVQSSALLTEMMIIRDWVAEYGDVWTTQPGESYVERRNGFYRKSPGMVTKEIILKLSQIIADLAGNVEIQSPNLAEALQYAGS